MAPFKAKPGQRQQLKTKAFWILVLVALMWGVALLNTVLGYQLSAWGIHPRTVRGLLGILLAPFIHNGIGHVLMNTIPFLVLGWLVVLHRSDVFLEVSLLIILLGGAATWLLARPANHVGASGLIFGYFGFLVARGWYERSLGSVLVAGLAILSYGGMLWGVLPFHAHVSWEGHLFGLLAGIAAARLTLE